MMRGINHQNIFEDEEDYYQFINTIDRMRVRCDDKGIPCGCNCTYYAYCLMSNHFHMLIREREETVGETVKRIASSYVYYYNKRTILRRLKDNGASHRQLERLTGIGRGLIQKL